MSRKLLLATTFALSSTLLALPSFADENSGAADKDKTKSTMTKDSWLSSMTPLLPDLICKGFMQDAELKKRFDEIKMDKDKCVSVIPESSNKCQNDLYSKMPDTISDESASTWGKALGECIGKDFAEKYLVPKKQ